MMNLLAVRASHYTGEAALFIQVPRNFTQNLSSIHRIFIAVCSHGVDVSQAEGKSGLESWPGRACTVS
jgi:hypothetical protein